MQKQLQGLKIPPGYKIEFNSFYAYNPELDYSKENNLFYLSEDLFQCIYLPKKIIVDLGWYGDILSNIGEFKIYVIANQNWEKPLITEHSKSLFEITNILNKILAKVANELKK